MIRFIVIYRDRSGANHTTAVEATTEQAAVKAVLRLIPCVDTAWVACTV